MAQSFGVSAVVEGPEAEVVLEAVKEGAVDVADVADVADVVVENKPTQGGF